MLIGNGIDIGVVAGRIGSHREKDSHDISCGFLASEIGLHCFIKLLEKYGMKDTFFTPGCSIENFP